MLTEARVILPGVQSLLGFQLIACFTEAYDRLPQTTQIAHLAALAANALSMALLMTPAALHRIAFEGADDRRFLQIGSFLVAAAPLWLALGLSADIYVALQLVPATRGEPALIPSSAMLIVTCFFWYAWPATLRRRR